MKMNRRAFCTMLGATGVATALGETRPSAAVSPTGTMPVLNGKEFQGLAGVYAPLFTPFTKDNKVNTEMLERMVERCLAAGLRGFYTTGSTGESLLLTVAERKLVLETVVKANKGRGKVIAHVGSVRTEEAVELARHAADAGADWTASIAPVFFAQSDAGLRLHYTSIANATDLPFMIYSCYGALKPDLVASIMNDCPNIKGMKYTGMDFFAVEQLKARLKKEAIFFVGHDPMLLSGLSIKGLFSGGIGTLYNMIPDVFAKIHASVAAGDFASARAAQERANKLLDVIFSHGTGLAWFKAVMRFLGFDHGDTRAPEPPLTEAQYTAFAKDLEKAAPEFMPV